MSLLSPRRHEGEEILDRFDTPYAELSRSLRDIRDVNRFLGGTRILLKALLPLLQSVPERPVRVLDLGTGSADNPAALVAWSRRNGLPVEVVGLDLGADTLRFAQECTRGTAGLGLVRGDALRLPFPDGAFHFVTASLFTHHLSFGQFSAVLREMDRTASRGLVVNDLVRAWVPWAFIVGWTRLFSRSDVTRYDGPVSVLKGFTRAELQEIKAGAGLPDLAVRSYFPYRFCLIGRKEKGKRVDA